MCEETELVFLVYQSKMKQNSISQLGPHNQLPLAQLTVGCNPSSNSTVQILTLLGYGCKFMDTEEKDQAYSLSSSSLYKSFVHTQKTQNIYFLSVLQLGKGDRHHTVTAPPSLAARSNPKYWVFCQWQQQITWKHSITPPFFTFKGRGNFQVNSIFAASQL